jgi:hypothetical protein
MYLFKYKIGDDTFFRLTESGQPSKKSVLFEAPVGRIRAKRVQNAIGMISKAFKEPDVEEEKEEEKKAALVEQLDKIASEIQEESPLIALAIDAVSDQLDGKKAALPTKEPGAHDPRYEVIQWLKPNEVEKTKNLLKKEDISPSVMWVSEKGELYGQGGRGPAIVCKKNLSGLEEEEVEEVTKKEEEIE